MLKYDKLVSAPQTAEQNETLVLISVMPYDKGYQR